MHDGLLPIATPPYRNSSLIEWVYCHLAQSLFTNDGLFSYGYGNPPQADKYIMTGGG
jgi:hypothetical protein